MTIQQVIKRVRTNEADQEDWLFILGDVAALSLGTEADLGRPDYDEDTDEETAPSGFAERGLRSTIDIQTIQDCIGWADRLSGSSDDRAVADVLRYYIRFDAFPDRLGAADPPPASQILLRLDREFYDRLGPEDSSRTCRHEGCARGTVRFSVLCRRHHFENIQKRHCPFED
jgi:hypothetical protein